MRGVLLIVCGPSGVGKTSLGARLREGSPELGLSVSYTTRAPRDHERDGVDYHFTDSDDFIARRDDGEFAEWARVHGNFYATPKREITRAWERGQDLFFDIDYQGAAQLKESFAAECVSVMIAPPSWPELRRRLTDRSTDEPEVIEQRLDVARYELSHYTTFDHVIFNDDFDRALAELGAIYAAARRRTYLHAARLDAMLAAASADPS